MQIIMIKNEKGGLSPYVEIGDFKIKSMPENKTLFFWSVKDGAKHPIMKIRFKDLREMNAFMVKMGFVAFSTMNRLKG